MPRLVIRNEMRHFINEVSQDFLRALDACPEMPTAALQAVCGLIVCAVLDAAPKILGPSPTGGQWMAEMSEEFVQLLREVLLGASGWRGGRG